jgi:hypothetical protein
MSCARCGGFVIRERLFEKNYLDPTESGEVDRCLNCGAIEDKVIQANRLPAACEARVRLVRGLYGHRLEPD